MTHLAVVLLCVVIPAEAGIHSEQCHIFKGTRCRGACVLVFYFAGGGLTKPKTRSAIRKENKYL